MCIVDGIDRSPVLRGSREILTAAVLLVLLLLAIVPFAVHAGLERRKFVVGDGVKRQRLDSSAAARREGRCPNRDAEGSVKSRVTSAW